MAGIVAARRGIALLLAGSAFVTAANAEAQDDPNAAVKAQTEKLRAEAELERAKGDRDKAAAERIEALGLPSFRGETKLNQGAGAMEATMLAAHALQVAAVEIGKRAAAKAPTDPAPQPGGNETDLFDLAGALDEHAAAPADAAAEPEAQATPSLRPVLVLAGAEAIDFSHVGLIETEMWAIRREFRRLGIPPIAQAPGNQKLFSVPVGTAVAVANAVAGLLRSETEITPVEVAGISERALANAVAGHLGRRAILPAAIVGRIANDAPLLLELNELAELRVQAGDRLKTLAKAPKQNAKAIQELTKVVGRFDTFFARVTTADEKGVVPIARAARLHAILVEQPSVLRVYVEKAGGSLINTKNITTTFGADPLRVTGGLVASYALTDPADGRVWASDIFVCRTTLSRLRPIHDASWAVRSVPPGNGKKAVCTSAGS
jgi:hypothetical protein